MFNHQSGKQKRGDGMRLVNADAVLENIKAQYSVSKARAIRIIESAPTVDAVPVVHGRWIKKRYWSEDVGMGERYGYYYSCSKCGNLVCGGYDECGKKYCDECGARMDGKDGDHETD